MKQCLLPVVVCPAVSRSYLVVFLVRSATMVQHLLNAAEASSSRHGDGDEDEPPHTEESEEGVH